MSPTSNKKISHEEAQTLNRAQRRRLGKGNGVKIVGTNKPQVGPLKKQQKKYSLSTFTGHKV